MSKTDMRPAVLIAGAVVIGGVALFATKKRNSCRKLPDIWSEEGPLHLTPDAQDDAIRLAKYKIREHVLSREPYTLADIVMSVADGLRECKWEDLETEQQRQAWAGIEQIVKSEIKAYEQNPDAWNADV